MSKKEANNKKSSTKADSKKNSSQKSEQGRLDGKKVVAKKATPVKSGSDKNSSQNKSFDKKGSEKKSETKSTPLKGADSKKTKEPMQTSAGSGKKGVGRSGQAPESVDKRSKLENVESVSVSSTVVYASSSDADSDSAPASNGSSDEIILTDAEGRRLCRVRDCDQAATVDAYCRFHYLLLWKRIQVRKKIIQDGKLERYVEELTSRYPDKFLEMIKKDLRSEKDFLAAIAELEIDESGLDNDFEDDNFMDDVRGVSTGDGSTSLGEEEEF